jgi:hypothetical protein
MKRIFHPYNLWEDCNNGILETNFNEEQTELLTYKAKSLLCNPKEFYNVGLKVIMEWKYSSEQNLSNSSRNRQAWIGQASCCYKYRVPEHITKYAWRLMTFEEQKEANAVADDIIRLWEEKNAKKIFE